VSRVYPNLDETCLSVVAARLGSAVALAFPQYPIGSLGQVPRDRDRSAAVAFHWMESLIEQADVLLAAGLHANGDVGGLHKRPLEVVVDVGGWPGFQDAER
jgi:hypothetical protein